MLRPAWKRSSPDHPALRGRWARDATAYLAGLGRTRIAAIGVDQQASATSRQRLEGLQLALHEAGVAYNPRLAPAIKEFDRYNGLLAMRALAALSAGGRPDAVFCFSDLLAVGANGPCSNRGWTSRTTSPWQQPP
ncbi:substrate-binding domain-containing protein [Streptomyces sp. 11-1-2]|uniref:substrate-binding domain-containing protein n=1 Tax=unclassified Streptomyces TaxID=2593676 RepID=UPI001F0904B4|nr:substrate-binding domain-containing protein [Streptomyces sp. 11-1-2]